MLIAIPCAQDTADVEEVDDVESKEATDINEEKRVSGDSSASCKRTLPNCDDELYYSPAMQRYHKNWKKFEKYVKEYTEDRLTMLSISETTNVRIRNDSIAKMKRHVGKPHVELPLVPKSMDPYKRVYICTHGCCDALIQFLSSTDTDNKLTDEDEVAELLVECNLAAEGNVASVEENSRGQSAVVSINSQHMRKMYQRFPELLLVDCTHKTNRYNYQLCTLMVMDQFGIGQAIQHSVIERNADWHMMKIIEHFQSVNPWQKTNVIMVDKNLNDIHVLKSMVFDSRVCFVTFMSSSGYAALYGTTKIWDIQK
ncbi:hypothetical protein GQ600_25834 [Phytophthora cactorum]|nr:hypothetical protein GQ600_25834 [Phytophthora cactorum]